MSTNAVRWPDRMNPTDALFWFMDKIPEMRSTIGALVILERAPSRERVRLEFERISTHLVRMRQRVVEVPFTLAPPEWVEDTQFDLDYHLRYIAIPAPGGVEELLAEMSPLYAAAFDRDRPLWEAYVAEGLLGGRGALFVKMHHCLMDGVGGTRLFDNLLRQKIDPAPAQSVRLAEVRSARAAALIWRAALYNLRDAVSVGGETLGTVWDSVRSPRSLVKGLWRGLGALRGFGSELTTLRAESPLHARRSLSRQLSTFEMSLPEIDAVRGRLGATNNDFVLTVVSGAMHRWHTSRGTDVHTLRALVPVNLRGVEETNAGNRLALLAVNLPVGEPNPLHRLRAIQEQMGTIKADQRARLYPLLARVLIRLPLAVAELVGRQQTSRTNFVCTNVPGPRQLRYFAGETIQRVYPYAPLVGDHPVAIALYSYGDLVCVGLDVDPLAMDDLPHFRDALREAYEELLSVGRQAEVRPRRSGRGRRAAGPALAEQRA